MYLCIQYYSEICDCRQKEKDNTNASELIAGNIHDAVFNTLVYFKQCYRLFSLFHRAF